MGSIEITRELQTEVITIPQEAYIYIQEQTSKHSHKTTGESINQDRYSKLELIYKTMTKSSSPSRHSISKRYINI